MAWTSQSDKIADFEVTKESVTLSLEGDVIQGDRFNIVTPFDNCNKFEELFTFHTVVNNPRIESLKNKEIKVMYKGVAPSESKHEYLRKAKIVSIVPFEIDGEFLNQHVVIFSLGTPQRDEYNNKLNDTKSISIKLVDYPYENENIFSYYINKVIDFFDEEKDLDFVANQYFDIFQNEWKSPNIMYVMKRQFKVCKELK